jgi:hypothetical protein
MSAQVRGSKVRSCAVNDSPMDQKDLRAYLRPVLKT